METCCSDMRPVILPRLSEVIWSHATPRHKNQDVGVVWGKTLFREGIAVFHWLTLRESRCCHMVTGMGISLNHIDERRGLVEFRRHLKRHALSFSRRIDQWVLGPRYAARRFRINRANESEVRPLFESIPIYVINLESRPDRLRETEAELAKMGIARWSRFDAVKDSNGALGCARSHARLAERVQDSEPAVMVCEDDVEFLVSPENLRALVTEFLGNPALDVLCLAYNLRFKPHTISPNLAVTADTATAACYVVKTASIDTLKDSFSEAARLIQEGKPIGLVAIDQYWKKLQRRKLVFAVPQKRAVRQRPSFSDIEGHDVFYGV